MAGKHSGRDLSHDTVDAVDALTDMWAKVDEARGKTLVSKPLGSFTVYEYKERFAVSNMKTASSQLSRMIADGKLIARAAMLPDSNGILRRYTVYTPVVP